MGTLTIGADVAKDEIIGTGLALESTGRYHELLARLAQATGIAVFVINPRDLRHSAKAVGARAKTDRMDAPLIARYLAHEHSHLLPFHPPRAHQRRIDGLLRRRAKLSALRVSLRPLCQGRRGLQGELNQILTRLDVLINQIDHLLRRDSGLCPAQSKTQPRLQTINGVGPIVSISLANLLARVPLKSSDTAVAFVGYDTRVHDSGRTVGRRHLSQRGPAERRRLLFLAAMAAAKTRVWKPLYAPYRARGLSATASLCVIARQLMRTAWSIHKYQRPFDPARLTSHA